jgi:outer membrane protein insertion porin family
VLYRFDRLSGEGVFVRELNHFTTARLTAHIEYVKIRNASPAEAQADRETGNNQIRRILQLYTERDTRDNILIPQKGSYSFGIAEYVGGILGGDFNYYKMQFSWSRYRILTGANVLATRIWLGWLNDMFTNGSSALLDRFIVGGSTTIRGYTNLDLGPKFESGPLAGTASGGHYMIVANVEVRRPLFWRFGGTAFMDGGNAYSHISDITPLSIRFSAGMGLQFFTPIGPIRLDYAVRLKKQFDLGAGLFHLSILYAF